MERELVCEGPCNPDVAGVDAAVFAFRNDCRGRSADGYVPSPPLEIITRLRRLVHTAHRSLGMHFMVCQTCGTSRKYAH